MQNVTAFVIFMTVSVTVFEVKKIFIHLSKEYFLTTIMRQPQTQELNRKGRKVKDAPLLALEPQLAMQEHNCLSKMNSSCEFILCY